MRRSRRGVLHSASFRFPDSITMMVMTMMMLTLLLLMLLLLMVMTMIVIIIRVIIIMMLIMMSIRTSIIMLMLAQPSRRARDPHDDRPNFRATLAWYCFSSLR